MKNFIKQTISLKLWNSLDIQFANMLVSTIFPFDADEDHIRKNILMIASACLSSSVRLGNTCLPLQHLFDSNTLFQNCFSTLNHSKPIQKIKKLTIDDWQDLLLSTSAVGNGSSVSPLVLENNCLYLRRIWQDECIVANFFNYSNKSYNHLQKVKMINILNKLFPKTSKKINWHKIAAAISFIHSRVFISGGPGTGKTSTIAKIITALLLYNYNLRIQITAATGKASAILTNSCKNIINNLEQLNHKYKFKPVFKAMTLHNLLGSRLYQKKNQYDIFTSILDIDCLIIDEASMISLSILSKLILSLPDHVKIIFLGDHHQLYSIEPGSIFQDVCQFCNYNYSIQQQLELKDLTGCILTTIDDSKIQYHCNHITNKICVLKENYRFSQNSGIGQLANAIKLGDYHQSLSILSSEIYTDIHYIHIQNKKNYISMIMDCAKKYYKYLKILKNNQTSVIKILQEFDNYRILCALKHGLFGVIQLNYYIEQILNYTGLITLNRSGNYIGKPIIVLCNDPLLGLYNGDTGVLLLNPQNSLSAYFLLSINEIRIVPIHQLPLYETCFAMTIHKAQGSEFQNISIILPNKNLPILTRELIYTAITRAHQQIFLYAKDDIVIRSIQNVTKRYSGLYDKMKKYSQI